MAAEIDQLQKELAALKRAQDALRDREARLRLMVEQMPAVLWTTDKDLVVTSLMGAALAHLGVAAADVVGRRLDEYLRAEGPPPVAAHRRALAGEEVGFELSWGGRTFQAWVEPLRDARAAVTGVIGVALDITDRRRVEDELKEAVKRSGTELDMFASVASHDLQEPLRKIIAFGDQLERRHAEKLGEEGRDYLGRMTRAADRMSRLIADLLVYARIEASQRPFEEVDLDALFDDLLLDMEPLLAATKSHVEVMPLPKVQGDRLQLRQLLQALLSNAVKFREPSRPARILVRGEREGGRVLVTVEDNGIGFDEKYLDRIFKPFTRLHPASKYEGTGLGLAIATRIAKRHDAALGARSVPDRGSVFTLEFRGGPAHA